VVSGGKGGRVRVRQLADHVAAVDLRKGYRSQVESCASASGCRCSRSIPVAAPVVCARPRGSPAALLLCCRPAAVGSGGLSPGPAGAVPYGSAGRNPVLPVPVVNFELNENMEFARHSSDFPLGPQHASPVHCRRVPHLQVASRTPSREPRSSTRLKVRELPAPAVIFSRSGWPL
jgi:hypothetical protein